MGKYQEKKILMSYGCNCHGYSTAQFCMKQKAIPPKLYEVARFRKKATEITQLYKIAV